MSTDMTKPYWSLFYDEIILFWMIIRQCINCRCYPISKSSSGRPLGRDRNGREFRSHRQHPGSRSARDSRHWRDTLRYNGACFTGGFGKVHPFSFVYYFEVQWAVGTFRRGVSISAHKEKKLLIPSPLMFALYCNRIPRVSVSVLIPRPLVSKSS
jgi:hypothetical protein